MAALPKLASTKVEPYLATEVETYRVFSAASSRDRFSDDRARGLDRFGREMREECVPPFACGVKIFGAERAPDAFLRKGRWMHGVVEKPGAVVIPQVMVRVLGPDTDAGQRGECVHDA